MFRFSVLIPGEGLRIEWNTFLLLYFFWRTQMFVADCRATAAIADIGQFFYLFTAEMPCVGDERSAPVTFFVTMFYGNAHVTVFTHFFSACRAYIIRHIRSPFNFFWVQTLFLMQHIKRNRVVCQIQMILIVLVMKFCYYYNNTWSLNNPISCTLP